MRVTVELRSKRLFQFQNTQRISASINPECGIESFLPLMLPVSSKPVFRLRQRCRLLTRGDE